MATNRFHLGIFDSGAGGISTVLQLLPILPDNTLITYYADEAHLPYGTRSKEEIVTLTQAAVTFLENQQVDLIICACHSASTAAREHIHNKKIIWISDIIIDIAAIIPKGIALILGTQRTIDSNFYSSIINTLRPDVVCKSLACPSFVSIAESPIQNNPFAEILIFQQLRSVLQPTPASILLCCTHFPLLSGRFNAVIDTKTKLIDPSYFLKSLPQIPKGSGQKHTTIFFSTGPTPQITTLWHTYSAGLVLDVKTSTV